MPVTNITATNPYSYLSPPASTKPSAGSEMDNFMTILLAQLKNQNPMEPLQDKDFMAQMAQFNSLKELQLIKSSLADLKQAYQNSYASSLLGKTVVAKVGEYVIEGVVTGISLESGRPTLEVNGKMVTLESIQQVFAE